MCIRDRAEAVQSTSKGWQGHSTTTQPSGRHPTVHPSFFSQSTLNMSGQKVNMTTEDAERGEDGGFITANRNFLSELSRRRHFLQRKAMKKEEQRSPQAKSLASLSSIYGQSPPATGSSVRPKLFPRDGSPSRIARVTFTAVQSPVMSRPADEERLLEGEADELGRRIDVLASASSQLGGAGEVLGDLLKRNLELYELLIDRFELPVTIFSKLRTNQERLNSIAATTALRQRILSEENLNLTREKQRTEIQLKTLKEKILQLIEVKQAKETQIKELEIQLESKKNKLTFGFDMRGLLDENEDLKQELYKYAKAFDEIKKKEVKLIKLIYFIKREGIDIDGIYQRYAAEVQNEDLSNLESESQQAEDETQKVDENEEPFKVSNQSDVTLGSQRGQFASNS
eukprot:TRINITY_DN7478_c0_g1_i3.p1 TRINITY_DN7478_c0_g1~~TRINITY_DN7478_c0_g1_i3.p1  ORF type:complete len:419 (-),score=114.31 TRINITY_DN7478_c0_g1_i3:104-1300(-)